MDNTPTTSLDLCPMNTTSGISFSTGCCREGKYDEDCYYCNLNLLCFDCKFKCFECCGCRYTCSLCSCIKNKTINSTPTTTTSVMK